MRKATKYGFTIALLALTLALPACQLRTLHLVITDFDTAAVQGVQVYRLDDATNQPVPAGQVLQP